MTHRQTLVVAVCLAGLIAGCHFHTPPLDPACRNCTEPVPQKPPVVKIYDVSDFAGGKHPLSEKELCDRIRNGIATGTWDWEGHSLGCEAGRLTVRHSPEVQSQVVELLHDLRHQALHERGKKRHQE
ncbi:MAG: hypothetical protein HYY93_03155 [Planctomycetes bacterium]|nr:hypothetical protein [Planctomycetota bacterium]